MNIGEMNSKSTEQGRETPVPVGAVGGNAGHARPSSSDCGLPVVDLRATGSIMATGEKPRNKALNGKQKDQGDTSNPESETDGLSQIQFDSSDQDEEINPFERRSSIRRTPPSLSRIQSRQKSKPEEYKDIENEDLWLESSQKRKRTGCSPEAENQKKKEKVVDNIRCNFNNILEEVRKLEQVVKNMYKPKQEIKEISNKMSRLARQLDGANVNEIFEVLNKPRSPKQEERATPAEVDDVEVQCPNCKSLKEKTLKRRALKTEESLENYLQISEEDWCCNIFPEAIVANKPIWEAPFDEQLVLPCSRKFTTNNRPVGIAIKKFGGQDGLIKQNKAKGEVAMMTYTIGFPDQKGNMSQSSRSIYYPIVDDGEAWEKVEDKVLFNGLKELKRHILRNKNEKIAFPEMGGVAGVAFKRMIEYLFVDTNVEAKVYSATKEGNKQLPSREEGKKKPQGGNNTEPDGSRKGRNNEFTAQRKKNDGLIVQMKDKTYAELLKTVKQNINPVEMGVDIVDITKTRKGDLLLKIGNGPAKAGELQKMMKQKLPGVNTSLLQNNKTIHIKGMDETATEEEIRLAICGTMAIKEDSFKLSSLRPAYGGKKNVTVIMPENYAERFLEMKNIRIGWTPCKIKERKIETRCYKCWGAGHTKAICSGPDREALCLKCAQSGHKAINCQNTAHCLDCKQDGHQTGSARCSTKNTK